MSGIIEEVAGENLDESEVHFDAGSAKEGSHRNSKSTEKVFKVAKTKKSRNFLIGSRSMQSLEGLSSRDSSSFQLDKTMRPKKIKITYDKPLIQRNLNKVQKK